MTSADSAAGSSAAGSVDRYAVTGHPVAHSLSPLIHQHFATNTAEQLTYELLPAPADGFAPAVEQFFAAGGRGLNVTLPFKEQAAKWVDSLDDAARIAGAVNTIRRSSDGTFEGFNTDGIGLLNDLQNNLGWSVAGKQILLIGAGGASRGALSSLLAAQPKRLVIANRTLTRAQQLIADVAPDDLRLSCCSPQEVTGDFDLVINATSASLSGEGALVPSGSVLGARCYDMLYANQPTVFASWAKSHGASQTSDGLGMLIEQAAAAFQIWRGVLPNSSALLANRNLLFDPAAKPDQKVDALPALAPKASQKQRFIAGAVCPECREIDRIVVRDTPQGREQACVACGYSSLATDEVTGGLQALVPRGKHEQPALSAPRPRDADANDLQPVRLVDPRAPGKADDEDS